jgi:hypothetical protein
LGHLGHLDGLGGGSGFGSLFLCLIFVGLFGVVLCRFLFFLLLLVLLICGITVGGLALLNGLALLVWWLGALIAC